MKRSLKSRIGNPVSIALLLLTAVSTGAAAQGQGGRRHESMFAIEPDLVLAQPCADVSCTYHWTLTSRFGQALDMAEDLFGPRDRSYTILGIDFTTEAQPSHWYPHDQYGTGKTVIVLLTANAASDENRALYQLSHESFHLLSSTVLGTASNLEEGLATYFSLWYMTRIGRPLSADYIALPKYRGVFEDVQDLVKLYPDMAARIKRFRSEGPPRGVSTMSRAEFQHIFPKAPVQLAEELTRTFQ
jgi:hypothetical protein